MFDRNVNALIIIIIIIVNAHKPYLLDNQLNNLQLLLTHQKRLSERLDYIKQKIKRDFQSKDLPTIYAITPTYKRYTQKADLTRLSQTFMHVKNFHWIVIEDSETQTRLVSNLLKQKKIQYTHLFVKTQSKLERKAEDPAWLRRHRGVDQRNLGLKWIRDNVQNRNGVVYFADDDNTYDLRLFEEVRVKLWLD